MVSSARGTAPRPAQLTLVESCLRYDFDLFRYINKYYNFWVIDSAIDEPVAIRGLELFFENKTNFDYNALNPAT